MVVDVIYATGFYGSPDRSNASRSAGKTANSCATCGPGRAPATYLGLQVAGFPNLFAIVGPQNAAAFCNMTRCIELNVDRVTDLIDHMARNGHTYVAPTCEAPGRGGVEEVKVLADRLLFTKVSSWFTGRHRPGDDGTPLCPRCCTSAAYRRTGTAARKLRPWALFRLRAGRGQRKSSSRSRGSGPR